ncbi:Ras family domain-containing protein [Cyclospora cayetanensis]|uniref:Ras family domain-containing protein n=1 Tax=Cyclospora cayetanensis TaxID=88456 RepID=A0A1D3D3H4_9EIME|nr:Ras family domain-containing protein [Cyclospora cayetanensis]
MAAPAGKEQHDYLFKFIIIGDAGAGKSCLLHQFIENKFRKGASHTIGVEFASKVISIGGRRIKLQIWDTAGQERYRSVTRSYYRGAAGALLVYDISNRESYNHLINWLADARSLARADISIAIVGNKIDVREKRAVTFLEASRFAQENDVLFLETSALTGEGVSDVFVRVARLILSKIEDGLIDANAMAAGLRATGTQLADGVGWPLRESDLKAPARALFFTGTKSGMDAEFIVKLEVH